MNASSHYPQKPIDPSQGVAVGSAHGLRARRRGSQPRLAVMPKRIRAQRAVPGLTLPSAPTDEEKYSFLKRYQLPVVAFSVVSMSGLLISQTLFATQSPLLWWFVPLIFVTLAYFLIALAVAHPLAQDFDFAGHNALVQAWHPTSYPRVDVFLPVCGEPVEVIRNAWEHIRQLEYPGQVTYYCLDEGADPELRTLCQEYGFVYLTRPDRGVMKKAGNLKYGFERSSGDVIVIFDADFCPRPDMLLETVPYFDRYPRLGILQTPQHFRVLPEQTWLERGAGAVQEWFYRMVQVSRNNHAGSICVGTNALYRRAALDAIGGPTQIGHSEDVHTGFDVRRAGWDLQYIPIIFAIGMCPSQVPAFLAQQYRWCMGSVSLLGSRKFWGTKLRLMERLPYISGFTYYGYTALFTFVMPVVPIVLLVALPEVVLLENYLLIVPSLTYNFVVLRLWHRHPYGLDAWATKMIYGWAHAFAIVDVLRRRAQGWQPTGAVSKSTSLARKCQAGIVIWGGATAAVWVGSAAWHVLTRSWLDFTPMLATGAVYAILVAKCARGAGTAPVASATSASAARGRSPRLLPTRLSRAA